MKRFLQKIMLALIIAMTFGPISQANESNDKQLNTIVAEFQYDQNRLMEYYSDNSNTTQYEIFPNNHRYQVIFTAALYIFALISATILMKITT
ncbi:MAG TPA: hypothetical protein ENL02_03440 [Epsilonproteobacteria bacterium]|nr:hypothetical protein [Campylobacterota bacterium]